MCSLTRSHRPFVVTVLLLLPMLMLIGVCGCGNREKPAKVSGGTPPAVQTEAPASQTTPTHEVGLYIFLLAGFLGSPVLSRVPPLLHTPLMSATNAISGISLIGSLVVAGAMHDWLSTLLGFVAVACSSTNVVG